MTDGEHDGGGRTGDHADVVLAAWGEHRPGWDLTGMAVLGRVARLERLAQARRADVLRSHDLSEIDVDVLASLWRHEDGLRPRDLRASMMIGSGTLTPRLDRLERRGLLSRRVDPEDKRGRILQLTAEGREQVPTVVEELLAVENALLATVSPSVRRRLADDLRRVLQEAE